MKMSFLESKPNPESTTTTLHTLAIASSLEATDQHIGGCFYELDHSKLPPELLNSTRILMVSEKDLSKVSVRFPSLHSLKAFLSENASLKNQLPAMDERCYFEPETSSEVLFRRDEISERRLIKRRRLESLVKSLVKKKKGRVVKAYGRDKLVEENMLKVLKTRGANAGRPIKGTGLRNEAWKLIGGTGLLKHMAGKVAPGGAGRCRNADRAMEYRLESAADLVEIRKEDGIRGPNCATMFKELKREMESKQLEKGLAMVTTTSNSLVTSMDWDQACSSVIQLKEKYTQLVVRNPKFEEQMQQASRTLSGMEEETKELQSAMEATGAELMYYSEAADVPQLTETKLERGVIEAKETKLERLRSAFRICRPQGTFRWPNMNISMSQHQIEPLAVPTTPSTAIQLDLVLPRSLLGLNEGSSSGSLANTSVLLCNVTNPPSHSPAFSRVPSETKDTNNRFSPTNLGEPLVTRYDDMRNLKGTTAIARIGQDYIHLASDQRVVLLKGFVLNDRYSKFFFIDMDIVSVGVGSSVICVEFLDAAFIVNQAVFKGVAHPGRVYVAVSVLMARIDDWENSHAPYVCPEEFLVSACSFGRPLIFRIRSRTFGGISYGSEVGYTVVIGGGIIEAYRFIQTYEHSLQHAALVESVIVVAAVGNPSTGGHVQTVHIPLRGDEETVIRNPHSVLQLLQRDWGYYWVYSQQSLFFVCPGFDYTEQNEPRLLEFLAREFPGSRTHIISRENEIIRMITFIGVLDCWEAWGEVKFGLDWRVGEQLYRLTFYEATEDNITMLGHIEQTHLKSRLSRM